MTTMIEPTTPVAARRGRARMGRQALEARDREIVRLSATGWTLHALAGEYALTRQRVQVILRRAGAGPRDPERMAERDRSICAELRTGKATREVAAKFGLSVSRVETIAWKAGIRSSRADRERDAEVVRRLAAGEKPAAIGHTLGLHDSTVRSIGRRHGVRSAQARTRDEQIERAARIAARIAAGESQATIAREYRVSRALVASVARRVADRRARAWGPGPKPHITGSTLFFVCPCGARIALAQRGFGGVWSPIVTDGSALMNLDRAEWFRRHSPCLNRGREAV